MGNSFTMDDTAKSTPYLMGKIPDDKDEDRIMIERISLVNHVLSRHNNAGVLCRVCSKDVALTKERAPRELLTSTR